MIDITGLMELFGEMENAEIERVFLTMTKKTGAKLSLSITPPERCVGSIQPEPEKAQEAVKEPEHEKAAAAEKAAPEPDKKSFSNEELKKVLEEAVKKPGRGGRPRKEKTTEQVLDEMARKRGEL